MSQEFRDSPLEPAAETGVGSLGEVDEIFAPGPLMQDGKSHVTKTLERFISGSAPWTNDRESDAFIFRPFADEGVADGRPPSKGNPFSQKPSVGRRIDDLKLGLRRGESGESGFGLRLLHFRFLPLSDFALSGSILS